MNKVIISVLGQDRPGILAAVTKILLNRDGNVENVSQTILQNQFAGIFIVSVPNHIEIDALKDELNQSVNHLDLDIHVKQLVYDETYYPPVKSEPFIITTKGLDRKGLVAGITATIARYGVNVWLLYLRYLLAKKTIESRTEIDKHRIQLEMSRASDVANQLEYNPTAIQTPQETTPKEPDQKSAADNNA